MSETSKTKPADQELVLQALDTLGTVQEEQTQVLHALEARPIADLAGVERRLDELADAIHGAHQPVVHRRRWWWLTPAYVTLAYVLGVASMWAMLVWQTQRVSGTAKQPGTATSSQAVPGKRTK